MIHGTYVGPLAHLRGKQAMLRPTTEEGCVLAQFTETETYLDPELVEKRPHLKLGFSLGFGWHRFAAEDFGPAGVPA